MSRFLFRLRAHCVIATSFFLLSLLAPLSFAEIVLVQSATQAGASIQNSLSPQAHVLVRNPHDGSILVEVGNGQPVFDRTPERTRAQRNLTELSSMDDGVTVMVEVNTSLVLRQALQDELRDFVETWGGREVWRSQIMNRSHFDIPVKSLNSVLNHPLVKAYWFDTAGKPSLAQSVPHIGVQGSYGPTYWPWGGHFYIAVLDTGVIDDPSKLPNVDHTTGACFSSAGAGLPSLCPNGQTSQYGIGAAVPCQRNKCQHGNDVAGVAVSSSSPNLGVVSTSSVEVMPLMVASPASNNGIHYRTSDVARGLDYVLMAGQLGWKVSAVVMSMDLTGIPFTSTCDNNSGVSALTGYVNSLNHFKTAVIASAGNASSTAGAWGVDAPACLSNAIAVGATLDSSDAVAVNINVNGSSFSSQTHNLLLDYWAPGAYLTVPPNNNTIYGTSFSAPHVAGVWTRLRAAYPTKTNADIKSLLNNNCPLVTDNRSGIPTSVTKPRICWIPAWL